jgi:hypothetical protein
VDVGEPGIWGVEVSLYADTNGNGVYDDGVDTWIASTTTSAIGYYTFEDLPYGKYIVVVTDSTGKLDGLLNTPTPSGFETVDNSSKSAAGYAITLSSGAPSNMTADFGYTLTEISLAVDPRDPSPINLSVSNLSDTTYQVVSGATNDPRGYTLFVQAGCAYDDSGDLFLGTCTSDNRMKRVKDLPAEAALPDYFLYPTAPGSLDTSSWGYQFNVVAPLSTSWLPVPTTPTMLTKTFVANPGSGAKYTGTPDDYDVFYGANIAINEKPGTYRAIVVYSIVGNI